MQKSKIAALHFGAGKIGRALISRIYVDNEIDLFYFIKNNSSKNKLKELKSFNIFYSDQTICKITKFNIINSLEEVKSLNFDYDCLIISTSIGINNMDYEFFNMFRKIIDIIKIKKYIICFENKLFCSDFLKESINDSDLNNHYINSMIDKIVTTESIENFGIFAEKYECTILENINDSFIMNKLKKNITWTDDLLTDYRKKFFIMNSTHFILGLLFINKGESVNDILVNNQEEIKNDVNNDIFEWFKNVCIILNREFSMSSSEAIKLTINTYKRIFDKKLNDKFSRWIGTLKNKLKINERLIESIRLYNKYSLDKTIIYKSILNIFKCHDNEQFIELCNHKEKYGIRNTLRKYTDLSKEDINKIIEMYKMNKW